MIKKNDIITLEIGSITNLGFGVARHEGLVVFVGGAVTGDEVLAKIIKVASSYAVGRVEKIIKKSELRDTSRCNISACSSCAYKAIGYSHEVKIKEEDVKEAFIKAGLPEVKVAPLVPSPLLSEYRNKGQYPIARDKDGNYIIGFFAPKSHRVTEARACPLMPKIFADIIGVLSDFFSRYGLSVYDEKTGIGLLRHIYLRRGEVSGEILLTVVINGKKLPHSDGLVSLITDTFPDVVGILLNENSENTNVILGKSYTTIFGRDYIYDTLAGVRLKLSAAAFYQVNHSAAGLLYKKARELAEPTKSDTLLDLFCGAGSIGLSMAEDAGELIGIEIVDSAVDCARENAKDNGITNAKFYTGDATSTENLLKNAERELGKKIKPSIIVLDPPRAGCDRRLIEYVTSLSPKRVVYISCNPETLARDVAIFKELGFGFGEITPFDLFPMTGHVESVVCLTRRLDN